MVCSVTSASVFLCWRSSCIKKQIYGRHTVHGSVEFLSRRRLNVSRKNSCLSPSLGFFDPKKVTAVSEDGSSYGPGVVMMKCNGDYFASCSTSTKIPKIPHKH
eukprot:TRINITY_DN22394_c0_g1_i1.p1 TRINITY_DN22394_c0_g1~~TRINITY_DN22394_c0_g1_i1.p1  ORF type:complete len:103 (+),score=14.37 TRINITY_DN22394_c0_g1_i1:294-602(+)